MRALFLCQYSTGLYTVAFRTQPGRFPDAVWLCSVICFIYVFSLFVLPCFFWGTCSSLLSCVTFFFSLNCFCFFLFFFLFFSCNLSGLLACVCSAFRKQYILAFHGQLPWPPLGCTVPGVYSVSFKYIVCLVRVAYGHRACLSRTMHPHGHWVCWMLMVENNCLMW